MNIEIKHRFTNNVLFACEAENMKAAVIEAVGKKVNLSRANLSGADLSGAKLSRADLSGAKLSRADLYGASLGEGKKLVEDRPFLQVGPIGSRQDYLLAFNTESGLFIRTGCFFGTDKEFAAKLKETHGDNKHGEEYKAALSFIRKYYKVWGKSEG